MKEDEIGGGCDKCGEKRKAYGVLVGSHIGRRPVRRTNHSWD